MIRHYVVTVAATAAPLSDVLPNTDPVNDKPLHSISMQAGAANANPVFIGGPGVSTTDYGVRIPAATGGVPDAPYIPSDFFRPGRNKLSDIFCIGTAGQKLHLFVDFAN
jgi:hypothetical protein